MFCLSPAFLASLQKLCLDDPSWVTDKLQGVPSCEPYTPLLQVHNLSVTCAIQFKHHNPMKELQQTKHYAESEDQFCF